ncbi:metallophosphoesterase family protein [uncultured Pelagimonas sp.]|uniref:metallophosphoesterase family protein n=1 Tax=uncultured Pelagimonas sp. TaxID=1618102 RepID=UPI00343B4205
MRWAFLYGYAGYGAGAARNQGEQAMEAFRNVHLFDEGGPVLIFGGPYSNLQATQAMRAEAQRRGIPSERCICTGDVVAYCGNPAETVAEIRDWGCAVVAGNCERQLASGAQDCGCGFEEGTTCDLLSAGWFSFASAALDQDARNWMMELPDSISFGRGESAPDCFCIHGGLTDISRFLWSCSPQAEFDEELRELATRSGKGTPNYVFAGHSGIPFDRRIGDVRWINAGVIGMPPNDGRQTGRFVVLDQGKVEVFDLAFDHIGARAAMEQAGLTQGYHRGLTSGFWPSEDVLPPELRRDVKAG